MKASQLYIVDLIQNTTKRKYPVHLPNFSDPDTMGLNEDIEKTIESLRNIADNYKKEATYVIGEINEYMLPAMLKLEIIIINAFLDSDSNSNKTIIDLFCTNTVENERILL